ncbi:ion transporter [Microseira sp. BLCC-F43]|jgi:voltage-gated sodium channel|uniref:ion transporter n=1 Tax=Microseira sp. BLCC-F43 TaxID=3153602 RepID=UPI0035BB8163
MQAPHRMIVKTVNSTTFQIIIMVAIVMSGVLVGIETYPEFAAKHTPLLKIIDSIIIWIFIGEFLLKITAEYPRWWRYFFDGWNIFDFLIIVAFFLPVDVDYILVMRMVRILRLLKLLRAVPRLQILVSALLKSLPSIGYVCLLLMLLFYMYGVVATFIFAKNDPIHFGTLPRSMLSLFQVATLEGWSDIMYTQIYGCDRYGYGGMEELCKNPSAQPLSPLFFVSFVMLGAMIVINLLVGVMIASLEEAHQEQLQEKDEVITHQIEENEKTLEKKLEQIQNQLYQMQTSLEKISHNNGHKEAENR